jgi:hypothetical protein
LLTFFILFAFILAGFVTNDESTGCYISIGANTSVAAIAGGKSLTIFVLFARILAVFDTGF